MWKELYFVLSLSVTLYTLNIISVKKIFSADWSNLEYKLSDQQNIKVNFNRIILRDFLVQGPYINIVWKINLLPEDMPNRDYKNY